MSSIRIRLSTFMILSRKNKEMHIIKVTQPVVTMSRVARAMMALT